MKFSAAVLLSLAQLSPHARPADVGRIESRLKGDENTHGIDKVDENTTCHYDIWKDYCDQPCKTQPEIKRRCTMPGQESHQPVLCKGCNFGGDKHDKCHIKCCDPTLDGDRPYGRCKCTPYKHNYDHSGSFDRAHDASTPDKCCGRNAAGGANIIPGTKLCGCTDVGVQIGWGGQSTDCCSGAKRESDHVCIRGGCAKKGKSGKCCRTALETEDRKQSDSCPCFHAGNAPNPNDEVGFENCCSGKANPLNNSCACISEPTDELPPGADASDCCTGKLSKDGKHCEASTCSAVGANITGGHHCCSGPDNEINGTCQCIASGKAIPDSATALDCCSGRLNGKECAFIEVGEAVPDGSKAESVCASGEIHYGVAPAPILGQHKQLPPHGKCSCIPAGHSSTDSTQCCSGMVQDGKCTCVEIDMLLTNGGKQQSCCSGTASPSGVCHCAPPGAPLPKGDATACCARKAGKDGKHCGCFTHKDYLHGEDEGNHCCGGPFSYNGILNECRCLMAGYAIGSWATQTACCNNATESGDVCK